MLAAVAFAAAVAATPALGAVPIPENPADRAGLVPFQGAPAKLKPISAPRVPRHKYMAPNGRSNIHNDGYMTDTYTWSGPLGRNLQVRSAAYTSAVFGLCGGTIAFDRRGRVVTVCIAPDFTVRLRLLDPRTLATIASYDLPNRIIPPGANPFQSFTGGGYFYLDNHDRAVIPTSARHLVVVALRGGAEHPALGAGARLRRERDRARGRRDRLSAARPPGAPVVRDP